MLRIGGQYVVQHRLEEVSLGGDDNRLLGLLRAQKRRTMGGQLGVSSSHVIWPLIPRDSAAITVQCCSLCGIAGVNQSPSVECGMPAEHITSICSAGESKSCDIWEHIRITASRGWEAKKSPYSTEVPLLREGSQYGIQCKGYSTEYNVKTTVRSTM